MAASAKRSIGRALILAAAGLLGALASISRADDPAAAPASPDEKTIYVPYEQLEEVFEKQGRGVYLPYEEFIDLWRKAVEPKKAPQPAPVPGVIEQALYEGTVEGDAARILGTLEVSVLGDGWSRIPLAVAKLGLESVTFPEAEPGQVVLATGDQGLEILARKAGRYKAVLRFAAPVATEPGLRSVTFPIPPSSVTRLDLRIPDAGVAVEVEPAVATTVAPNAAGETGTRVLAVIGVAPGIRARWRPRVEEAAREPMAFADLRALLRVRAGFLRSEISADYKILQAPLGSFGLDLPEGYTLLSVTGEGIRDWKLDGRALAVTLHAPVRDAYSLSLVLERALAPDEASIAYPAVRIRAAQRETGTLSVAVAAGLKVKTVRVEGLSQIDVSGLPAPKDEALVLGYRYLRPPHSLDLAIEKVTPRIVVDTRSVLTVDRESLRLASDLAAKIERAGIFRAAIALPAGWTVESVQGTPPIEDHRVVASDGAAQRIEIDLGKKVEGDLKLSVVLRSAWKGPSGRIEVAPPLLDGADVQAGIQAVAALPALKLSTIASEGWTAAPVAELGGLGIAAPEGHELVIAYRWQGKPAPLALASEPRETRILASIEHDLAIEEGLLRARILVRRTILYAGTASLAVRAPKEIADAIRVEGGDVKETKVEPIADDPASSAIRIALQSEVLGEHAVTLRYERRLEEPAAGEPLAIPIPVISVLDVFREEGWIAVRKAPVLDVEADPKELDPVDVKELPEAIRAEGVSLAFRYVRQPWALSLRARKLTFEAQLATFVRHAHIDTVVTPERKAQNELTLAVRNKRAQFLRINLPKGSKAFGVSVAGGEKPISLAAGTDAILVDLSTEKGEGDEFAVRLRYDTPLEPAGAWGRRGMLALVSPDLLGADAGHEIPVGRFTWTLYLPPDYRCVGYRGNLRRIVAPTEFAKWLHWEILGEVGGDRRDLGLVGSIDGLRRLDAGGAPLPYRVVTEGLIPHTFARAGSHAQIEVRYLERQLVYAIEIGIAAFILLLGGILMRLGLPSIAVVIGALLAAAYGAIGLPAEYAQFADGAWASAGLLAIVGFLRLFRRGRRLAPKSVTLGPEDYVQMEGVSPTGPPANTRKDAKEEEKTGPGPEA